MSRATRAARKIHEHDLAEEQDDTVVPGIRAMIFDEKGTTDLGVIGVDTMAEVIGDAIGEERAFQEGLLAINQLPVSEPDAELLADVRATMTKEERHSVPPPPVLLPEPQSRMSQERLDMRIRKVGEWKTRCPKREGSVAAANWALYIDGMTVSAYLASHDRRRARRDLQWDLDHGFVALQDPREYMEEQKESN